MKDNHLLGHVVPGWMVCQERDWWDSQGGSQKAWDYTVVLAFCFPVRR